MIRVRYRKDPHMQNSMRKLKLTLTLTLTLTDTEGAVLTLMLGYRSLYITWQYRLFAIAGCHLSNIQSHERPFISTST